MSIPRNETTPANKPAIADGLDLRALERPLRVLFIEDLDEDVQLAKRQLERNGYLLTAAQVDSSKALSAALQQEWDIVLSDYNMPGLGGDQALEMVRAAKGPDLPFIVVSGAIGDERAVDLLKAGANDFVVKTNIARLNPTVDRELRDAQLRRERREAVEGMRRAIEMRDEFLSIASHELKTPLTALLLQLDGVSRLVRRHGDSKPLSLARPKLEVVGRLAHRLGSLIDRLLDISHVTSGSLDLQLLEMDLAEVVTECVRELAEVAAAAKSELRWVVPESLIGRWDQDRLEIVVMNLLANAIKYGGGQPIDVRLEDLGNAALVTVRDRGIGIASEDQRRIFERFERAVSSRHFGGFGVGLWLSRQIIEAHGGTISVRSEPGRGSTFEVQLPRNSALC